MASRVDLARLRSEVRAAHRRATNKASRLRSKGVEVRGTNFDPRRNPANIKKYNATQLRAYQKQLTQFTSRRTSFEAGVGGAPLPGDLVRKYRTAEKKFNTIAGKEYSKVADIPLPGRGLTVRQADMVDRPTRMQRAGGMAVNRPYERVDRKISNVTSARALERLTKQMQDRTRPTFKTRRLREQREELLEMLTAIGNQDLIEQAVNLSDDQFNVFWNFNVERVNEISRDYEFMKLRAAGTAEEFQERIHDSAAGRISETLQWASRLPERSK